MSDRRIISNKAWFQDQLADHGLTYRSFAAKMGIHPPDASRIINSQRNIKADEAVKMAKIFNVGVEEILKRSMAMAPIVRNERTGPKRSSHTEVIGVANEEGVISDAGGYGERRVIRPAKAAENTVAIRVRTPPFSGWIAYFEPIEYVNEYAVGHLCVVETYDGKQLLRLVGRSASARVYTLAHPLTGFIETYELRSAALVTWLRQEV